MNDARLKQIELQNERALFDDRYALVKELSKALRESQAREAKARDIVISTIKSANHLEDQLDKISGGHAALAESILVDIIFDLRAIREALKETKP